MSRRLSCWVAVGTATLLVGSCSDNDAPTDSTSTVGAAEVTPKQHYLNRVNGLCDELMTKVIQVTDGGSIEIPARQYLKEWPAHQKVLAAFD